MRPRLRRPDGVPSYARRSMLRRWWDYFTVWFRRRRDPPRDQAAAKLSPLEQAKMRATANQTRESADPSP